MRLFALLPASAVLLAACAQTDLIGGGNDSQNRVVDIVNQTNAPMQFSASNATQSLWRSEQFSSASIGSGRYITLNFDDGTGACIFDFKAEFSNGREARRDNINVCVETAWTVY